MKSSPTVTLIEFNELCPVLVDRFMKAGRLPNFRRFYDESHVYVTDAEEQGEALNPWVQWVTVHTGLSAAEHGVSTLSQSRKVAGRSIWDHLSDAGLRVWIGGSMNAGYKSPLNGNVLPDPWSSDLEPYPQGEFEPYHRFVTNAVREHSSQTDGSNKAAAIKFLSYMVRHGLSGSTVSNVLCQLAQERFRSTAWRRAMVMDRLQYDVFRWYYRKTQPDFSTFFLNSTAHFQHSYWRHMEPEHFAVRPDEREQAVYARAIQAGYENMDYLLGRLMKLTGPQATLVFCTALSQEPYLQFEESGGRHYYRIQSPGVISGRFGVEPEYEYEPLMAEQFYLRFQTQEKATAAAKRLNSFRLPDKRVFETEKNLAFNLKQNGNSLLIQCRCNKVVPADAMIVSEEFQTELPFHDVFYKIDVIKSGQHHPDGLLWIRSPDRQHVRHKEKKSLRTIAPTVLSYFDVPRPSHMLPPLHEEPTRDEQMAVAP